MAIKFNEMFPCEVVSVQHKPYLFTNMRVERDSVPQGMFKYDVRDGDCDGQFWEIQKTVFVNHWCTIIGKDRIELDDYGQYWCPPDKDEPEYSSEGYFLDAYIKSPQEYIEQYPKLLKMAQDCDE